MAPESTTSHDGKKHKNIDQEIKELISALTSRLGSLHRHLITNRAHDHDEEDEQGVRIITLAGSNVGATMQGEAEKKPADEQEQEEATIYVNSNFQAINNSIMLGGSYRTNDPGVRLDISDYISHNHEDHEKRKHKGGAKIDHHDKEPEKSSSDEEES